MKFMIVLGTGGHTAQMLRLVNLLGDKHQYEYVIGKDDNFSEKKIKIKGKIFRIRKTREIKESIAKSILKQLPACVEAKRILKKSKAETVIACGPNIAVPIIFMSKLMGRKVIFIESWSRVYSRSLSGRFAYKFADLFFVQWPEMKKLYPKAIYAGRFG